MLHKSLRSNLYERLQGKALARPAMMNLFTVIESVIYVVMQKTLRHRSECKGAFAFSPCYVFVRLTNHRLVVTCICSHLAHTHSVATRKERIRGGWFSIWQETENQIYAEAYWCYHRSLVLAWHWCTGAWCWGALEHSTKLVYVLLWRFRASPNWCYIMTSCSTLKFWLGR